MFYLQHIIAHNEICAKLEIKFNFCILINLLLDWVHDRDGKRVVILDTNTPFELDCQLNDPRVTVTVTVQLKKGDQNVDPQKDINVTQSGQKFRIDVSSLSSGNYMELKCQALGSGGQVVSKKTVTLEKAKGLNLM